LLDPPFVTLASFIDLFLESASICWSSWTKSTTNTIYLIEAGTPFFPLQQSYPKATAFKQLYPGNLSVESNRQSIWNCPTDTRSCWIELVGSPCLRHNSPRNLDPVMHHALWLASVGLLATSASAFYPYEKPSTSTKPQDNGSKHRRFYSLPGGVGVEHDEPGVLTMDIKKRPSRVSNLELCVYMANSTTARQARQQLPSRTSISA
jgi:hypothetical protein